MGERICHTAWQNLRTTDHPAQAIDQTALYGSALVPMVLSIPPYAIADYERVRTHARMVELALILVPFVGIVFLRFMDEQPD